MEVKIHKKGIIVLPAEIRKSLNITEGNILKVEVRGNEIILKKEMTLLDAWGIFEGKADPDKALKMLEEERRKDIEKEKRGTDFLPVLKGKGSLRADH